MSPGIPLQRTSRTMTFRRKSMIWISAVLVLFVVAAQAHQDVVWPSAGLLFILCFACELVDSGLGMGYGTILTPTLLFMGYQPQDIVPTVLLSELLSGFTAAFFHHTIENVRLGWRGPDTRPALILAGGSVVGVSLGVMMAIRVPGDVLKLIIGAIILISGVVVVALSRRVIRYRQSSMVLLAAVASFNKAASGGGYGPLVTSGQILSGVRTQASVGITSFAEAFTCLIAVVLFMVKGGFINLTLLVPMLAGALVSVPFAVLAINRSRELQLRVVIGVVTALLGAFTIVKALG